MDSIFAVEIVFMLQNWHCRSDNIGGKIRGIWERVHGLFVRTKYVR